MKKTKAYKHQSKQCHRVCFQTAQDASLTVSQTFFALILLVPCANPVVTEAMMCKLLNLLKRT